MVLKLKGVLMKEEILRKESKLSGRKGKLKRREKVIRKKRKPK
jgi:hypothetical protein